MQDYKRKRSFTLRGAALCAALAVGFGARPAAAAPFAYVTGSQVSVIDTATNTVTATVAVGNLPVGVAVTPDGAHVYVANGFDGTVSVIATATNTVVASVAVGTPAGFSFNPVGIVPPTPFLAFRGKLVIESAFFALNAGFDLKSGASIDPTTEPVTLSIGTFSATIPPGSFKKNTAGIFIFVGKVDGVSLTVRIEPASTLRYAILAVARGHLAERTNPVPVVLLIGPNRGLTSIHAQPGRLL